MWSMKCPDVFFLKRRAVVTAFQKPTQEIIVSSHAERFSIICVSGLIASKPVPFLFRRLVWILSLELINLASHKLLIHRRSLHWRSIVWQMNMDSQKKYTFLIGTSKEISFPLRRWDWIFLLRTHQPCQSRVVDSSSLFLLEIYGLINE